jgi:tetratricopeptide (TPR) repeat protein
MSMKRLALAVTVLTGALCLASSGVQAQERFRAEYCTRELARSALETLDPSDAAMQRNVAVSCGGIGATARGIQAARARFYSGRAYSRVPGELDEAIRQLEIAVNTGRDFEGQFRLELRAAQLELVQVYRMRGRIEAARNLLGSTNLRPGDPAVGYQRALLILAELGEAGQESAFDALKGIFTQDYAQLRGSANDPSQLSDAEIRRGRSWLYWLGMTLGSQTLELEARDGDQRRRDALRAIDYFRPVADTIGAACPRQSQQPLNCAAGIDRTEQIGSVGFPSAPSADSLMNAFLQLGIAHLKAAGVQETPGLSAFGAAGRVGEAGGLDCLSAPSAADAVSHFQSAEYAFNTILERSAESPASAAGAHWGLGCTILSNIANVIDPNEQQRRLARAVEQLGQAPDRPLTQITLARALVIQGQMDRARASYQRALTLSGANSQCPPGGGDPDPSHRAELPSRVYVEIARTRFAESGASPGDRQRLIRGTRSDLFTRTISEIRTARPGGLRDAVPELRCAVFLNYNNAEARLTLGHIYVRLGSDADSALDPPPFANAGAVLRYFERPASGSSEGRAEGLFLLSKRLTLIQQHRLVSGRTVGSRPEGRQAVSFAAQAYNSTQRPEFRRQACLAQMLFGDTQDEGYCSTSGQGDERAESSLFEGMYWLRRGQRERNAVRLSSWSRAIQAFNRGLAEANGQVVEGVHPTLPAVFDLQEVLHYGERYVLRCARLDYGDRESASDEVKSFFRLSGMPDPCGGAPR